MSSKQTIDQIKDLIHQDVENEIRSIEADAKAQEEALKEKFREKTERTRKEFEKMTQEKITRLEAQTKRMANTELKNKLLSTKREFLIQLYQDALIQLTESNQYDRWIEKCFKEAMKVTPKGIIIAPKRKKEETKRAAEATGTSYEWGESSDEFTGGFKIIGDRMEIDASFETILQAELWEQFEIQLNDLLFN